MLLVCPEYGGNEPADLVGNLENEGINPTIRAHIEPISRGDQSLEMAQPSQTGTRHQLLARIAIEAVQSVVTFGSEHPDNRVRAAICCRHNGRPCSADLAAPCVSNGWPFTDSHL